MKNTPLLVANSLVPDINSLQGEIQAQLDARLRGNPRHYNTSEIQAIALTETHLFPTGFQLTESETEEFRALCNFSQVSLRPARITSHRKYLGPIIVFLKRCSWPLLQVHLKNVFAGVQEFQIRSVVTMARQLVENRRVLEILNGFAPVPTPSPKKLDLH